MSCYLKPVPGHEHITFDAWDGRKEGTLHVRYRGLASELIAAGIVSADMLAQRGRRRKRDPEGHSYALEHWDAKGRVTVFFKSLPEDVAIARFPGLVATVETICHRFARRCAT